MGAGEGVDAFGQAQDEQGFGRPRAHALPPPTRSPRTPSPCTSPMAALQGTTLRGNTAQRGGGGAIYRSLHNLTHLYCSPDQAAPLPYEALTAGCPDWSGNTAGCAPEEEGLAAGTPGSGCSLCVASGCA